MDDAHLLDERRLAGFTSACCKTNKKNKICYFKFYIIKNEIKIDCLNAIGQIESIHVHTQEEEDLFMKP